jgi:hypothetical protein
MTKNTKYLISFLIAFIILIAILYYFRNDILGYDKLPSTKTDTITNIIFIPRDPIHIEGKAKIVYRNVYSEVNSYITISDTVHDTTYFRTSAFTAIMDTIIKKDTICSEFLFPEMFFKVDVLPHPDSVIQKTITIEIPYEKKSLWLNEFSKYATGTAIGAAITTIGFIWLSK